MKKLLAAVVLLALCLTLFAACAPKDEPDNSTGGTGTPSTGASSSGSSTAPTGSSKPNLPDDAAFITIAEALELCGEEGNITTERYFLRGTVDTISNATYGAMTISDETGSIYVYGTYSEDGSTPYNQLADKPYKGDQVVLSCILQNYNGNKEVKNAWLLSFEHADIQVDTTEYPEMTILQARSAATGTKLKVDGIVAQITYANGMIPTGIYLVDETNAILIHDGDLAQRVQIGNQITIAAEKTYWILDSEQNNAANFGYKGSCQLENAILVENDQRTDKSFDHAWIPTSTVKDILQTPVSTDITTTIYKVNALVKRVDGKGFVNYYFYDLDGTTGAYTYTQCNGSDFAWLDAFDGKICTVYLSAINAKTTATDCYYRLQPIQVIDEGFACDGAFIAEHVVKYYGINQFLSTYTGDPMLELRTSVSSEILNFQNAKLSYASSDPSVVGIKELDGKLYMHGIKPGTATVTVTGSYAGAQYSQSVEITIAGSVTVDYISVQDAIHSAAGTRVTIKGIVGPSVVNQPGFYLIDETGVIPVAMGSEMMETLKYGQEIILEGTRDYRNPKDSEKCIGQTYLTDPAIITNNYGTHEYSTASFITDKDLAYVSQLNPLEDHSTSVFILKGTVRIEGNNFYTNVKFADGDITLSIYCSSANQYEFLKAFDGQEVTVELAACNWNSKNYYAGCILAVYTEEGKIVNLLNFQ